MKRHSISVRSAASTMMWLSLALSGFVATANAGQMHLYVATNGNDAWSGRLASPNGAQTDGPFALRVGDRYFVRNLLEELDAPGEWYLDRGSDTLYFWPPDDIARGGNVPDEVWVPVIGTIVAMKGANLLALRGFTVEACDGDAVRIHDCDDCVVAGCVIRNCGAWGVSIRGGHRSGAIGNDIYATGAGGVSLDGGNLKTLERGDNFATNNYIHHIAEFQRTYNTGVNVRGFGNTADHNLNTKDGGKWMRERNKSAWQDGQLVWTYRGHREDLPEFEFDYNCVWSPEEIAPKFELTLTQRLESC